MSIVRGSLGQSGAVEQLRYYQVQSIFWTELLSNTKKALTYTEDLFPAYLGFGEKLGIMGLFRRAKAAYRQSLKMRPNHPAVLAGLNEIQTINSIEHDGLQKSEQILRHHRISPHNNGLGALMGFKDETMLRDRLRFSGILFNERFSKADRPEAVRQIQDLGKALSSKELAHVTFLIEGHTDLADKNAMSGSHRLVPK